MSKTVYILRGLPGSGKSTEASKIAKDPESVICSADNYFIKNGKYTFNAKELPNAHYFCAKLFMQALKDGVNCVVVDNTNIKKRDYRDYLAYAEQYGYTVKVVVVGGFSAADVEIYHNRNTHKVPKDVISRMASQFEPT